MDTRTRFLSARRLSALAVGLLLTIPGSELYSQKFSLGSSSPASSSPESTSVDSPALESSSSRIGPTQLGAALQSRLPALIANRQKSLGTGTTIGVAVLDSSSGNMLFEHNADQSFAAASNAKILTAAAALDYLGADFQFRTELLGEPPDATGHIPGDLYLRGRGDASFDEADMVRLVRRLGEQGVTRIDGGIVVDNSYFDAENLPPHFDEQPDEYASYRSPIAATSYAFNAWSGIIRPSLSGAGPARVVIFPPNDYIKLVSTVSTIRRGRTRLRMETKEEGEHLVVNLSGQIRVEVKQRRFRRRVPDPVQFVGTGLRRALQDAGIAVRKPKIRMGAAPDTTVQLAVHQSLPLGVMIRGMGKYSNNFVAELLLKVVGAETMAKGQPATWNHGVDAVSQFLLKAGIEKGRYRYENGSGLFDSNRLSPRQIVSVLQMAQRDYRWGPDLVSSLSVSGGEGTLSGRMDEGPAARRIRAKTGTLDQASALSGIAAIDGNAPLLFSILLNGFPVGSVGIARALQNDIGEELIRALSGR
jgi:serine-type D-Ala-D-Ala carboxypeptidase/endopeptidase (penicillin-binding protein 4)